MDRIALPHIKPRIIVMLVITAISACHRLKNKYNLLFFTNFDIAKNANVVKLLSKMKDAVQSFFFLQHLRRLFRTVRFLKGKQVFYRLYYPLKRLTYRSTALPEGALAHARSVTECRLPIFTFRNGCYSADNKSFTFLGKSKSFGVQIDWGFPDYGLLWQFHLHYFDWLNDPEVDLETCFDTINQFIDYQNQKGYLGHAYPASLRVVNWIRFFRQHQVQDQRLLDSLYRQVQHIAAFPEWDLMGNHLLQNAIALMWGGDYFGSPAWLKLGESILKQELDEQVLQDGAHFEKSISYHSFLLMHLMSLTALLQINKIYDNSAIDLKMKCSRMLSYLSILKDGSDTFPHFGDSAENELVSFAELTNVAQHLRLEKIDVRLQESGIRKLQGDRLQLFFNSGLIPAAYQPGHSHADALTFCLNVDGNPVLVDAGISTYERSERRLIERGTERHNTVCIAGADSAEIWAAFRMGRRPQVRFRVDEQDTVVCEHDGYEARFGIRHERMISVSGNEVQLTDSLKGWKGQPAYMLFHFYPGIRPVRTQSGWIVESVPLRIITDSSNSELETYEYGAGFNQRLPAYRLKLIIEKETTRTSIIAGNGKTN